MEYARSVVAWSKETIHSTTSNASSSNATGIGIAALWQVGLVKGNALVFALRKKVVIASRLDQLY